MEPNSLKTGTTQTLQLNPQKGSSIKPTPTVLKNKLGTGQTKFGGTKQMKQKSKMQTTTSEKDNQIVREGSDIVTPKILITAKMTQLATEYLKLEQEELEKEKKDAIMKRSASIMDSSVMQSADKSSGSDNKASSSGIKDSSFMESKKSDNTESEEDSKVKSDGKEDKKSKKTKQLTDKELDELVTINLSETETQFLLFIPSSQIAHDNTKAQEIQNRNSKYEQYLKERIGSDNYTNRQAQTFNYAAKFKESQSYRVEKNDQGAFASNWDIFDAQQQEQLSESQQLQELIKKSIDKELNQKTKNPFCFLSTTKDAINLHTQQKVPGSQLQPDPKARKDMKASNVYGSSKPAESSSINPTQQMDDTNKELSGQLRDVSGSKFKLAQQTNYTKQTKQTKVTEQTLIKMKQDQDQLDNLEGEMIKKAVELSKQQPSDEEILVMSSQSLEQYLKYVDRILNQNTYHKQYILYRNYPEVKIEKQHYDDDHGKRTLGYGGIRIAVKQEEEQEQEKDKRQEPLSHLFKFGCDQTKGRTVSYADWNSINQDLLAVTYGELELNVNQEGQIMFWTLKNPSYPERIIKYPTRVTCCKFSQSNPNLLAMGTYDGIIAIYDLRKKDNIPVAENREMVGDLHKEASKHSDAVWEVHWVGRGGKSSDKGEGLVSISSDGRIVEWSMKKGLEYTDLMNLKRSANPQNKDIPNEGINFRQTAGFSLDFLKGESSMYLVATEDGAIHRCSKSYSEQYLDSYHGHSGPVYKVRCNPFWSDIFLSCSADWSAKLWNIKEENPIQNFQSLDLYDEVMDIDWSPYCSTLFASVCKDGRLELWDLEKNNMIDPFTEIKKEGLPSKTMVRFCQNAPVIITGDIDGDINCYRLHGYEDQDPRIQQEKLQKLLYPTGYLKGDKGEKIEDIEA